ncbi:DNA translocase FtsK, partial [Faecalibacillus faecis]
MAKTSRKRKSKQDQISEELKLRIVCLFVIFLLIISAMQLGFIGEHLDYIFSYLFGNLNGIVYLLLISVFSYIVFKASYPKFNGPKAVGIYFLLVGVTIFISATPTLKGMKVIQSYISQMPLNRGGFIGALLYGCLSALFDYVGSIIAAVFIIIVGIILLGSKFYFEHKKEIQKKAKMNFDKTKTSLKNSSTYFSDFFKKKQSKTAFFDDDIFEDEEDITPTYFEEIEKEDASLSQRLAYNQENQQIDIVDKKPKIEIEEMKELEDPIVEDTGFDQEKTADLETVLPEKNDHYQLPPVTLLHNVVNKKQGENKNHAVESAERLTAVLNEFGVHASINNISIGPSITKYEL